MVYENIYIAMIKLNSAVSVSILLWNFTSLARPQCGSSPVSQVLRPPLKGLPWLAVNKRIKYKLWCTSVIHSSVRTRREISLHLLQPALRELDSSRLVVFPTGNYQVSDLSLVNVSSATLDAAWNSLPAYLQTISLTPTVHKRLLQTHLFTTAF